MTSKVAKCERIFSNGEDTIKLSIDYQVKQYSISPSEFILEVFTYQNPVSMLPRSLAILDLIRKAIEFAEKELTEKEQAEEAETDKPQEKVKEKMKIETTMDAIMTTDSGYYCVEGRGKNIPTHAKVTIEWTEE